ncbi:hypothetical protein K4039_06350 [Lyngbya sp. CCAP 1446/10]|uniref:hypothetical protein n=1 Tax=Microcoleaceae TaxID=1892252 RepID=UPI002238A859|nr:hypothetical protein [Lyngbya sp. CCAP 1446/10]MCW6049711.1 hypothetical protein [Lyngbya sp. CCAP 1446/10]
MNHGEFSGTKAHKCILPKAISTQPIILEDITELSYEKLYLIERNHPAYEIVMSEVLKDAFDSESSNRIKKGEVHDWLNSLLN